MDKTVVGTVKDKDLLLQGLEQNVLHVFVKSYSQELWQATIAYVEQAENTTTSASFRYEPTERVLYMDDKVWKELDKLPQSFQIMWRTLDHFTNLIKVVHTNLWSKIRKELGLLEEHLDATEYEFSALTGDVTVVGTKIETGGY